ncbi:hypothetical protein G6F24_015515 [Rhizopus arrhizus]|nr:hypothetical protein G6F24_015515 [Rhizopus arrhizus]
MPRPPCRCRARQREACGEDRVDSSCHRPYAAARTARCPRRDRTHNNAAGTHRRRTDRGVDQHGAAIPGPATRRFGPGSSGPGLGRRDPAPSRARGESSRCCRTGRARRDADRHPRGRHALGYRTGPASRDDEHQRAPRHANGRTALGSARPGPLARQPEPGRWRG